MKTSQETQIRLSLIGPSGAGKSTVGLFIQRLLPKSVVISIAQPLREIEECVYQILGQPSPRITGAQDGRLLQEARSILLSRDPEILQRKFIRSMECAAHAPLVVNDDCRRAMKATLDALGFNFAYVQGDHVGLRPDASLPNPSPNPHDQVITKEECHLLIRNQGDLHVLLDEVRGLLATEFGVKV